MRTPWSRLLATVALVTLANGCCTSRQRASEINAELYLQNVARAEPTMRRAARQQGAELLPDLPRGLGLVPECAADGSTGPRVSCVLIDVYPGFEKTYRLLDHDGHRRIAIPIGDTSATTRLARRGTTFFQLTPTVTYRKTGHQTACECDGGPVIMSMSGDVNLGFAFVVDDLPEVEVQQVMVPIVEDFIEWECKATLV